MSKELVKEFDKLKSDLEKWKWVKNHQDTGIIIYLDNDVTFGKIENEQDEENPYMFYFYNYVGDSYGVFNILEELGIKVEGV